MHRVSAGTSSWTLPTGVFALAPSRRPFRGGYADAAEHDARDSVVKFSWRCNAHAAMLIAVFEIVGA
jgi:hypothetical protein